MIFTEMENWSFVKHNSSLHPWVKLRVIIQTCWTPAQPQTLQQMSQPQRRSSTWGGASCLNCTRCTPHMREALCWWLLMVLGIWNIYQKWIKETWCIQRIMSWTYFFGSLEILTKQKSTNRIHFPNPLHRQSWPFSAPRDAPSLIPGIDLHRHHRPAIRRKQSYRKLLHQLDPPTPTQFKHSF